MHGAAQKRLHQNGIPLETARAQDDSAPRANADAAIGRGDAHPGDLPVLGDELFGPRVHPRRHPEVQQALEEAGDQRGAGHAQVTCSFVDRGVQPRPGLGVEPDVGPVGRERRYPRCPFAQLGKVEGHRAQRSATPGPSSRELGPVVGEAGRDLEVKAAVRLDEVEHRRAGAHERLDQLVVHRTEGLRAQILQRVGGRQFPVGTTVVGRYPHDAAGHGGGAADGRCLLVNLHRSARHGRGQRGGETGAATAEHDDVDFVVP